MNFLESLTNTIVPHRMREAISPELGAVGGDPDSDAYLYRSLNVSGRDLSDLRLRRSQSIAYWLWLTNPYAKRGIDIIVDFVIGLGPIIEAKEEPVQELLDEFWMGRPWNFDFRLDDYMNTLHLFGELVFPFTVNPVNGKVVIGYIDPDNIQKIELNENNALELKSLKLKQRDEPIDILTNPEQNIKRAKGVQGCFLFQINKIINATRGTGVLMPTIDWLASLDDFAFGELERAMMLKNFIWDVTITGATEEQVKSFVAKEEKSPPKPGSFRAHSEKIAWQAVTPDLKTSDTSHLFKLLFNIVAVGLGVPEHWLGAVGFDINRSTAREMNEPVIRRLQRRQQYVQSMFGLMFDFVIHHAKLHKRQMKSGRITESTDTEYVITFPDISARNMVELSETLNKLVQSLSMAQAQQWITSDAAGEMVRSFLESEMGMKVSEEENPEEETETRQGIELYESIL